ncbi:hypothetical protein HFO45_06770 [Rhizobium leguminosarum]|uniref:hypothetical protein n=1 Tax=Rhizobium leguminosarum TaxID=384 RepID=UPI001C95E013|nr:hypothetical protein [Rhizobium leguminosarum]MBY5647959.1 hypothetical protein [Rhizobium leguminosarum]
MDDSDEELQKLFNDTAEKAFETATRMVARAARHLAQTSSVDGMMGREALLAFAGTIDGTNMDFFKKKFVE